MPKTEFNYYANLHCVVVKTLKNCEIKKHQSIRIRNKKWINESQYVLKDC